MSVAHITRGLTRMVAKLEAHSAKQNTRASKITMKIESLTDRRSAARAEAAQAEIVAGNIRTLFEDSV